MVINIETAEYDTERVIVEARGIFLKEYSNAQWSDG